MNNNTIGLRFYLKIAIGIGVGWLLLVVMAKEMLSQTAGTVVVQTTITATAGAIQCVITPGASQFQVNYRCVRGSEELINTPVNAPSGTTGYSFTSTFGTDSIATLLKRNASGLDWQMTANGTTKNGSF